MYVSAKVDRLEEAVVMEATAALTGMSVSSAAADDPLIRVKVLSTGAVRDVPRSHIAPLPVRAFCAGEWVRRAMWSGAEEDAEVRCGVATTDRARALRDRLARRSHSTRVRACAAHGRARARAAPEQRCS